MHIHSLIRTLRKFEFETFDPTKETTRLFTRIFLERNLILHLLDVLICCYRWYCNLLDVLNVHDSTFSRCIIQITPHQKYEKQSRTLTNNNLKNLKYLKISFYESLAQPSLTPIPNFSYKISFKWKEKNRNWHPGRV